MMIDDLKIKTRAMKDPPQKSGKKDESLVAPLVNASSREQNIPGSNPRGDNLKAIKLSLKALNQPLKALKLTLGHLKVASK